MYNGRTLQPVQLLTWVNALPLTSSYLFPLSCWPMQHMYSIIGSPPPPCPYTHTPYWSRSSCLWLMSVLISSFLTVLVVKDFSSIMPFVYIVISFHMCTHTHMYVIIYIYICIYVYIYIVNLPVYYCFLNLEKRWTIIEFTTIFNIP